MSGQSESWVKEMTADEMTARLTALERNVLRSKTDDNKTKYQVVAMFRYLKELIRYQVPTPPVNVSEDGHKFECPTCGTAFDSEDHVDDFNLCYICGQRWKGKEEQDVKD